MIPFGPFHPDASGINTQVCGEARNVMPAAIGFKPLRSPMTTAGALNGTVFGAAVVIKNDGNASQFAGTATKLYNLQAAAWVDVSRLSGGAYATPVGERWRFEQWGSLVIATNYLDTVQKFDTTTPTAFTALGGSPPRARYIAVVRDQIVLGGLFGNENRIHWSGTNNSEFWTPGTQNCDFQDFPNGGPIRGIIGGAVGYVFQPYRVTRMTQTPGASTIYQFDEVQGAKGLAAPGSLVKVGDVAYYLSPEGFYEFDTISGGQKPVGINKWRSFFLNDMRAGTELSVYGAIDPVNPIVLWAYISRDNSGVVPDRVLIYDRSLDEATIADISVEALASWITSGVTLDTMNSFGTLDALPYSLDSPFWKAGSSLIGIFGSDHKLAHLQGTPLAATFTTADGQTTQRMLVSGTRPYVDATGAQVAIAMRERDADQSSGSVAFPAYEAMEDTGIVPAWASGNIARAKINIPAGEEWTSMKGIETVARPRGRR